MAGNINIGAAEFPPGEATVAGNNYAIIPLAELPSSTSHGHHFPAAFPTSNPSAELSLWSTPHPTSPAELATPYHTSTELPVSRKPVGSGSSPNSPPTSRSPKRTASQRAESLPVEEEIAWLEAEEENIRKRKQTLSERRRLEGELEATKERLRRLDEE
jgi:hypothetical protein